MHKLPLFPAALPLEFVAIVILGPSPRAASGNQHGVIVTNRYSKTTRTFPIVKATSTHMATIILDNWILRYGVPNYLLTDNGAQFVSIFFTMLSLLLGIKKLMTTTYHLQTNGQVECYNCTVVARMPILFPNIRKIGMHTYNG